MTSPRTKFYLDKQNAKWSGVCAGIADYTGMDVTLVRIGLVVLTILGGFPWTLIAYWVAAWMAPRKPLELYESNPEEKKFWQGVRANPRRSARDADIAREHFDAERVLGRFRPILNAHGLTEQQWRIVLAEHPQ